MAASIAELHKHIEQQVPGEEAAFVRSFSDALFEKAYPEFLKNFDPPQLLALTRGALRLVEEGGADDIRVRVYHPTILEHGWGWNGSAMEIHLKDRPFLVDSVRTELRRRGAEVAFNLHPILRLKRDDKGKLVKAMGDSLESYQLYLFEERFEDEKARQIEEAVQHILDDVVLATDDYVALRIKSEAMAAYLTVQSKDADPERAAELRESAEFIHWLGEHNFVFLGFREYNIFEQDGKQLLQLADNSGLGILRGRHKTSSYHNPVPIDQLPEHLRKRVLGGPALIVTKANAEATVHRGVRMDYIGVKKWENGQAAGELRLLGLFTSQALSTPCKDIPILRRKLGKVLELDGSPEGSHDYKQIVSIFNSMPREELFWAEPEQLVAEIRTIMRMESEHRVRLTVRRDPLARGVLVMVIMPRERFNAGVRLQIQELLQQRFNAHHVDYQLSIGEDEELVRFHFFLSTDTGVDGVDLVDLEKDVSTLTRTWHDRLAAQLELLHGEATGRRLAQDYAGAFNEAYVACNTPEMAAQDIARMEEFGLRMYRVDIHNDQNVSWLKIYHRRNDLTLSDTMPYLENLGLCVLEQLSFSVQRQDGQTCGVDVYRVLDRQRQPLRDEVRVNLAEAMQALLEGKAEDDRLNGLVLGSGLSWRQVSLLRVYQIYLAQIDSSSRRFINDTLLNHPKCARRIFDFFEARFRPETGVDREKRMRELREDFFEALNRVSSLAEDRILRAIFNLVESTIRTNFYRERDWISLKISSLAVAQMPDPRPLYEIIVVGPGVEGIHLRGGKVARGGLRWSDRPDFRTEVLGLMKTQMTKNAVIVPVGSKGGFLLKRAPAGDRNYVTEQYKVFIRGLLDLTDNIVEGKVLHPEGLVIYDEADPYLVVAADKGTATFSDVANGVAAEYNFWLGDAFASGGSYGYDHKKEGITARGAWECVKRHFREGGIDLEQPFTVAGIGDLSGDVFGNGLIYSDQIKLLAAFNHMHIFLDPYPDPAASYAERARMFNLPRSTWEDYDKSLISRGGGVHSRGAKSITLTPEVKQILGVDADSLSGDEMVKAILRMPVDLLWNGGIGVYVKCTTERNVDVGDSSNDNVRVNANELRCRVVGEGGNNGFTQLARVEYARAGGRINTDAIDNSAGVDMSDHEVNIKILLQPMVASGRLRFEERNLLLGEMTDEVNRLVLADNYRQSMAITVGQTRSKKDLGLFTSLIDYLEDRGVPNLNREVEFLPEPRQLAERQRNGEGLTRPELAIVLAYTKMGLFRRILETDITEEPHFQHYLYSYFPRVLAERYSKEIAQHQLRREIIATQFTNKVVDLLGITFVHRTIRNTGATPVAVVRAALMALEILNLDTMIEEICSLDGKVPADAQYEALQALVETVESVVNQMLLIHGVPASVSDFVKTYRDPLLEIRDRFPGLLSANEQTLFSARQEEFEKQGFPREIAGHVATLAYLPSGLGVVDAARLSGSNLDRAAQHYYGLGERLALGWLRIQLSRLLGADKWETIALEGLIMDLRQLQLRLSLGSLVQPGSHHDFLAGLGEPVLRFEMALKEIRENNALSLASGGVLARHLNQMALSLEARPQPVGAR